MFSTKVLYGEGQFLRLFSTHRKNKLAARTFIQSQYLKALAAGWRGGFAMSEKEALRVVIFAATLDTVLRYLKVHLHLQFLL